MTSWPSDSKCRATHSLSVDASSKILARGCSPRTAVNRSRLVTMRRSVLGPIIGDDAQRTLALVEIESYRIHWLPPGSVPRLATMSTF